MLDRWDRVKLRAVSFFYHDLGKKVIKTLGKKTGEIGIRKHFFLKRLSSVSVQGPLIVPVLI